MTRPADRDRPSTGALLVCDGIEAGYGPINVVRRFDLAAPGGTIIAILGPNGAGKTTLLTTLAGLYPAQAGSVSVAGTRLKNGRPNAASRAGLVLVPDDRSLFTTLTVVENLDAARAKRTTSLDDVFDLFPKLADRRTVTAGNLSGGEQQMLAIARGVIQEPRVLLIDEMSMGLAPVVVESLLPVVRRIAEEASAVVVLVEQHVGLALEVADRAMVMTHGDIALDRPAAELAADPSLLEATYFGNAIAPDQRND
ncbi:MAG TPA: ATP-binding cassette domain-containing protein [Microthrixaceae bacterium]|nr:ATP-binding cassette domain-containing protein [Microthrixaceae bacterium]